jgi:signal transduction histidine kinase/CheY-like chemotaxis protein/AraC-like DNA-binding protein
MSKSESKIQELEHEVKRLKASVEELRLLNDIAVSASKETDVDLMLNVIVKKSIKALDAEQSLILLVTKNPKDPFKTIIRQDDRSSLKHTYHVGEHITGWVLLNKEALVIEDLSKDMRFHSTEEEKKDIHSVLCVPIWFEGNIIGVMMAINKKNKKLFSKNDLTLFSIISVQAGQLIKNLELQRETFQKIKETEKLHELDRIKTNFFTNISHEFRTPLTLILGPLEKLMSENKDAFIQSQYALMQKNANNLLKLINQLLDLSSIDAGKMKLNIEKGYLIGFIKGIIASFNLLAEIKNIKLIFSSNLEQVLAYFDKDKLEKIVSNLLSNAVKFTSEKGEIAVSFAVNKENDTDIVEISVADNGIGIPSDELKNIFDRFSKANNSSALGGTGIGLALVKELVELHGGSISVKSEINKGTKFKISLPLKIEYSKTSATPNLSNEINTGKIVPEPFIETIDEKELEKSNSTDNIPLVLIVEDEKDIRNFIKENIGDKYKIIESPDGKDGIKKSIEYIPDLIISDIIMPVTDGIELCKNIKSDEKTSHIPIILLTAKSAVENKLEGLETGADDYLTKPFNISELQVRVSNLIEQRRKLRERFRKEILLEPKEIAVTSADEKFLYRIANIIEKHISDYNFSVDTFANEAGMSRMQLHRKLNAVTGQSAGDFIRNYRLKRAAKLLQGQYGNIAEVAYDVGFNNPSYFSDCFKKLFGALPSEYVQNIHTGN